jgi:hypothetical protein
MLGSAPTDSPLFRPLGTSTVVLDVWSTRSPRRHRFGHRKLRPGPVAWQHTISATASDRYLLVGVSTGSGAITPTAVTFELRDESLQPDQRHLRAFIWPGGPARGTATITVTLPAGPCSVVAGSLVHRGRPDDLDGHRRDRRWDGEPPPRPRPRRSRGQGHLRPGGPRRHIRDPARRSDDPVVRDQGTVLGAGDTERTGNGTFPVTMSWT